MTSWTAVRCCVYTRPIDTTPKYPFLKLSLSQQEMTTIGAERGLWERDCFQNAGIKRNKALDFIPSTDTNLSI